MSYLTLLPAHATDVVCTAGPLLPLKESDHRLGANRKAARSVNRLFMVWLLASGIGLIAVTQVVGTQVCKPILTIKEVEFSEMEKSTLERRWTAIVSADASRCTTTAGSFEVGFSRLKENGIEIEFRERFSWLLPSVKISVDFWADEAVESHWIDSVQECPCAR
jgi:hypothetical protein